MATRPVLPPESSALRSQSFWRGWAGLVMIGAGLVAACLMPPDPAGPEARLSFLPPRGPAGLWVVLEGRGLQGARSVRFGTVATRFRALSDRRVEALVPEGAGSAPITLTTAGGQVLTTGLDFQVTRDAPAAPRTGPGPAWIVREGRALRDASLATGGRQVGI